MIAQKNKLYEIARGLKINKNLNLFYPQGDRGIYLPPNGVRATRTREDI